jgi:ribonuclease D
MQESVLPDPIWVENAAQLNEMLQALMAQPIVAVDTESNSLYAYRERVCLIQFSIPQGDYLLDPLAPFDLSPLGTLFADPQIEKIFHAAEYDVICLRRDFSFTFTNLFDTMLAGRVLGRAAVGLASMLESEFGIVLDKHYQRANWGQRPLKPAMLAYARLDTHYLLSLRNRLKTELKACGRLTLAMEDFYRISQSEASAPSENGNNHDAGMWKLPGIQDLGPHQLAVLSELWRFRDHQARAIDQPHFKVISNQALFEVAQTCPRYIQELGLLPNLSDRLIQRYGRGMLDAVRRGLTAGPVHRPTYTRPDERLTSRMEALRSWRKLTGQTMGVESDVILPRDILMAIAENNPHCKEELATIMNQTPWRYEHFGEEILRILPR